MKYYILTITFITLMLTAWAQPSDATVKAKATSDGSSFMEFVGNGKIHTNLTETWYIRVAVTKSATQYPGVTHIVATEYKYMKFGGSWRFDRTFGWWDEYEGIPNPSEAEIQTVLTKDLREFLGGAYSDVVGEISAITLSADPKWTWHSLETVEFLVDATYDRKTNSTTVTNTTQQYKVRLSSDGFKGPWKSFMSLSTPVRTSNSKQTYTSEEIRAMPTLLSIDQENAAIAAIAHLPEVDVPVFSNVKELIVHTHNMLRTYSRDEMHAYLRKTFSKANYAEYSTVQLSSWGEGKLNAILKGAYDGNSTYKDQYCEHPSVKHDQETMMELWNKLKNRHIRISVTAVDGTYKISDIQAYVFSNADDIAEVEAGTKCGDPIATEAIVVTKYAIGDAVEVNARGVWKKGKVNKLDDRIEDRYYISYFPSGGVWSMANQMRSSTGGSDGAVVEGTTTESTTSETTAENVENTPKEKEKEKGKLGGKLKELKGKIKIP